MRLIPVPGEDGRPTMWLNPDHLVSVMPIVSHAQMGFRLAAELKIEGMQLLRVQLGEHESKIAADAAFEKFLAQLQNE